MGYGTTYPKLKSDFFSKDARQRPHRKTAQKAPPPRPAEPSVMDVRKKRLAQLLDEAGRGRPHVRFAELFSKFDHGLSTEHQVVSRIGFGHLITAAKLNRIKVGNVCCIVCDRDATRFIEAHKGS